MSSINEDMVTLENVTISYDKETGDITSIIARGFSGDSNHNHLENVRNGVVDILSMVTTSWKSQVKDKSVDGLKSYFEIS